MRLDLASRASVLTTPARFLSATTFSGVTSAYDSLARSRSSLNFKKQHVRDSSIRSVLTTDHRGSIGNPEPPWIVLPPETPENPFSGDGQMVMVTGTGTGVPFSLRLVQKKKRLALELGSLKDVSSLESAVVKAISSLAFMIGELQRSLFVDSTGEEVLARVSRDRSDSFAWLFRSVFSAAPNLVSQLLILLNEFVVFSAGNTLTAADKSFSGSAMVARTQDALEGGILKGLEVVPGDSVCGNLKNCLPTIGDIIHSWSDIGIKDGKAVLKEDKTCSDRLGRMYEWRIASGEVNSLILSNYAQFLYRVAQDHDRAYQYFQWAVAAEPCDAEAMSRYAMFLWEVHGDVTAAEEMFVEAMDADPGNPYHNSNYAWFLTKTGGADTCYPIP